MRQAHVVSAAVALLVASTLAVSTVPASAETRTYFGFRIDFGNAPPPPRVEFVRAPRMVMVPGMRVMVLGEQDPGYDMFRYGSWYYVCNDGYWYRARSFRGPFGWIDARKVPRPMFDVPGRHWRHHPMGGPPGQMRKSDERGRGQEGDRPAGPPERGRKSDGEGRGHRRD